MEVVLVIVLVMTYVVNGASDFIPRPDFRLKYFDRRALTDAPPTATPSSVQTNTLTTGVPGTPASIAVPATAPAADDALHALATSDTPDAPAPGVSGASFSDTPGVLDAFEAPAPGTSTAADGPDMAGAPTTSVPGAPATIAPIVHGATVFDVSKSPGAKGDGQADNTRQVNKVWADACQSKAPAKILIPQGDWLVGELNFTGPCTTPGPIIIEVQGTLKAKPDVGSFPSRIWINIFKASAFVMGGGIIDGNGETAWKSKKSGVGKLLPDSLGFHQCPRSGIENIHIVNSKGFNVKIAESAEFKVNLLNISCPVDSPNTDGIHIGMVRNVSIVNSIIGTGDDCISIGDDSQNVNIANITCGPGHGISIGGLGKRPGEKDVRNIAVSNCRLTNTTNGARIKSFHESPVLQATNISFTDFTMENVTNPIIIDQNYASGKKGASKVKITGVTFRNFKGSSFTNEAITLECSADAPCEGISLENIEFTYCGTKDQKNVIAKCEFVKPKFAGKMMPNGCTDNAKEDSKEDSEDT